MYWKLAIQNIRRSLRDYIIYFVTLTFTALCDVLLFRDELFYYESFGDRKSTRLNSSHTDSSRMPSSA